VDVLLIQELSAPPAVYQEITDALIHRGFVHNTGEPSPVVSSQRCQEPPLPDGIYDVASWLGQVTGTAPTNGGLVTWSKVPIESSFAAQWCLNGLPTPAGYLATLVKSGPAAVIVINLHMIPGLSGTGVPTWFSPDIRTYQFSELAGLTKKMDAQFQSWGVGGYSIIVGGDFNEDMYGLTNKQSTPDCSKITQHARTRFEQLGLDLTRDCCEVGFPTWDASVNDLAENRGGPGKYEVLDYIIQTHSSTGHKGAGDQVSGVLAKATKWQGEFCNGPTGLPPASPAEAKALSDHNWVRATFKQAAAGDLDKAKSAFNSVKADWGAQGSTKAACGQKDIHCWEQSDCCHTAQCSWNGEPQRCDANLHCANCKDTGSPCNYKWWTRDTECCQGSCHWWTRKCTTR
jgi:hypothetical protein